jgi:hypothetical protein
VDPLDLLLFLLQLTTSLTFNSLVKEISQKSLKPNANTGKSTLLSKGFQKADLNNSIKMQMSEWK